MDQVLIVSGTDKGLDALSNLMDPMYKKLNTAKDGETARCLILSCNYDLVVINTPLPDELGKKLAMDVVQNTRAGVVLLAKNELLSQIETEMGNLGILVLEKPLNKLVFQQTMRAMAVAGRRMQMLERENKRLQNKIEETRLVTRAKLVLMDCLKMSEENAHYYIEHQAMDRHCTKLEIAQSIIRTYHN